VTTFSSVTNAKTGNFAVQGSAESCAPRTAHINYHRPSEAGGSIPVQSTQTGMVSDSKNDCIAFCSARINTQIIES